MPMELLRGRLRRTAQLCRVDVATDDHTTVNANPPKAEDEPPVEASPVIIPVADDKPLLAFNSIQYESLGCGGHAPVCQR